MNRAGADHHDQALWIDFTCGGQDEAEIGGQKQRTAIARAIIRDPKILILDDALASVDTYTEERILSGLKRNMEGRTTVFISHRISTARNADQIAVMVAGRIAELGTHDELIARNGYYTSLFEKQRLEEELSIAT